MLIKEIKYQNTPSVKNVTAIKLGEATFEWKHLVFKIKKIKK